MRVRGHIYWQSQKIKIMFHVFRVLLPGFSQNFSTPQSLYRGEARNFSKSQRLHRWLEPIGGMLGIFLTSKLRISHIYSPILNLHSGHSRELTAVNDFFELPTAHRLVETTVLEKLYTFFQIPFKTSFYISQQELSSLYLILLTFEYCRNHRNYPHKHCRSLARFALNIVLIIM